MRMGRGGPRRGRARRSGGVVAAVASGEETLDDAFEAGGALGERLDVGAQVRDVRPDVGELSADLGEISVDLGEVSADFLPEDLEVSAHLLPEALVFGADLRKVASDFGSEGVHVGTNLGPQSPAVGARVAPKRKQQPYKGGAYGEDSDEFRGQGRLHSVDVCRRAARLVRTIARAAGPRSAPCRGRERVVGGR